MDMALRIFETLAADDMQGRATGTKGIEKARDYLMKLPPRMYRLSERIKIPENSFQFKWVDPA